LLWAVLTTGVLSGCFSSRDSARDRKVLVLGIDGLDPHLLHQYMREGRMPNFERLEQRGSFRELGTSIPPQSPVAWSNVITGMNPGGHGIFDFIHRDPHTLQPDFSISRVEPPAHTLKLGSWVIPLSSGRAALLRHGLAFWQILDAHGIPATVVRMPSNFPPAECKSRTLAGMGTPDMLGTYGTFSFYSSDPLDEPGVRSGGNVYPVEVKDGRVSARLFGPHNTFRRDAPQVSVDFTVWIDPVQPVAKLTIQDHELVLQPGEWSEWVQLRFPLVPGLESATGICRFYLKQLDPFFKLYVTPINLDPSHPALPLSTPRSYVHDLWEHAGFFYTQGIAEDTKALSDRVLSDGEYLEQAKLVLGEQLRFLDLELGRFRAGLLFVYFSSLDQNAHMFWRAFDRDHPGYDTEVAAKYGGTLAWFYEQMDAMLGKVLARLDDHTTLLVISDHGFAPFRRSFNLNTWLLENGYLALRPGTALDTADLASGVDWPHTRAYGLGLNGLYLNLRGRERYGTVAPGGEAEALRNELQQRLLAVRDPATGLAPITRVDKAEDVYTGPYVPEAPDLIVGYNRGYRAGWKTVLGQFSPVTLEANTEPWSGDHCIDYTLVPGVLLSNRPVAAPSPRLTDIAPTILAEFGIPKPPPMVGQSVFLEAGAKR
jgi:predicted AlkP superfamily phosphohydrolase/phosphomutase